MKLILLQKLFNAIYIFFTWVAPVKQNKITFCTNRSESLTGNLDHLYQQFKEDSSYEKKIICFNFKRSLLGRLSYVWHSIASLYHIATSRVFVVDDYFMPIYCIKNKRAENLIIQVWHAIGHLKRYGLSIDSNKLKRIRPHTNYDYVFANAASDVPAFVESFDVSADQVIVTGAPRIDDVVTAFNGKQKTTKRPSILYAPTYRTAQDSDPTYDYINKFIEEATSLGLTSEYRIYISLHPYIKMERIKMGQNPDVIIFQDSEESNRLLKEVDILITDYSSILLDYAFFEKYIFIYAPDYQSYVKTVGFFVDYKNYINGPFYEEAKLLVEDLVNHKVVDNSYVKELKKDNYKFVDGQNSRRCYEFIVKLIES